jgi:multidrug resistance efflux pump
MDFTPIRYVNRSYRRDELAGIYRAAKAALVTPLRDGMNLVAKEYVAAQDPEDPGVLILSRFAGAARQMKDALIINPNSPEEISDALERALSMGLDERKRRWNALFENVTREDVTAWRDNFVSALRARPDPDNDDREEAPTPVQSLDVAAKKLRAQPEAKAKVAVEAARSRFALSAARLAQARRDAERAGSLFERHSISRERNEKIQTDLEVAKAQDDAAREELRLAEAAIPTAQALVSQRQAVVLQREARIGQRDADVKQKESAFAEARLYAGYTEVTAPADGYVTRKNVESGQVVAPGQILMAVASLSDVWVVANYKETQIEKIRPGQPVNIGVDTYPGRKFKGKVDSIMAGTGSAFSLFPPENATGNYVKVVQRVPVKIVLERGEDPAHLLRIGMSVEPTVLVR